MVMETTVLSSVRFPQHIDKSIDYTDISVEGHQENWYFQDDETAKLDSSHMNRSTFLGSYRSLKCKH